MALAHLSSAILKTIAFFDILDYPLEAEECHTYLYGYEGKTTLEAVRETLKTDPRIGEKDGLFFLKGREHLVTRRMDCDRIKKKLWKKVEQWKWIFRFIPFIREVYVCNSLALGNIHEESDIDLFFVTAKNRLFLARFFTVFFFQLFGIRRHGAHIRGRFCLSFWKTEDSPFISPLSPEDPYLFFWQKSLISIYSRSRARTPETLLAEKLERFLRAYQLARIERKKLRLPIPNGIMALPRLLKLHDRDRRNEFYEKWRSRLGNL